MRTQRWARRACGLSLGLVLGLIMGFGLGGCEGMNLPFTSDPDKVVPEDEDYLVSQAFPVGEFESLWERAKQRLNLAGYAVDGDLTQHAERLLVSHWKTQLAPQRYKGRRSRCWLRFQDEGAGDWAVAIVVQMQRNTALNDPTNAVSAVWEEQPADPQRANLLAFQLESDFSKEE